MENEEKIGYVYMITSPTGRIYIGSSIDIKKRFEKYKRLDCKTQPKLYRSFLKYSVEQHNIEIIWNGYPEEMKQKECILGHFYNCLDKNKGKQFNKAFSYYCSLVDFQYQYCFFQEFEERRWWAYRWAGYYYIDKVGNIQYRKPKTRNNPKRSAKEYYETLQAQRKAYKIQKKAKLEKEYSMLTREEAKDKHESMIKLISHGFDSKTSFRNH